MAVSAAVCTSTQILGKRRTEEPVFLALVQPKFCVPIEANQNRAGSSSASKPNQLVIVNGKLQPITKKRYQCTYEGCDKAYTKPSRLAEHERSHTGERPYQCETCKKSYLRESHLHAHMRSHLPASERSFMCPKPGCQKRFWTLQHLKAHTTLHEGAKPFICPEEECTERFAKHHQLRSHIASVHSPPGTKPYRCEYTTCTKSFATNQKLKAHIKTHDERRYMCVHSDCVNKVEDASKYFPTWSALQTHIRNDHPPTCSHPSCKGRIFATQKGLRAHVKLHDQRDMMEALEKLSDDDADNQPAKRRRGGEWDRDWTCDYGDCTKDFKSKKALTVHKNVTHLGQRNFICSYDSCKKAYGYKHLLQRHVAKSHGQADDSSTEDMDGSLPVSDEEDEGTGAEIAGLLDINTITGNSYARSAEARIMEKRALRCPFPHIHSFIAETGETPAPTLSTRATHQEKCDYAFSRAYDLRRHLRGSHNFNAQKEHVDLWVAQQKLSWFT